MTTSQFALAETTIWDFQNLDAPLSSTRGSAVMSYRGATEALVDVGSVSEFGLPALPGGESNALSFPAFAADQGFAIDHQSLPNGVHIDDGWLSNYTLVFDLYWPEGSDQWRGLYNTNPSNANDADVSIDPAGRIGVDGQFPSHLGTVATDAWHRIAIVVGAADGEGQMQKYIDGQFVGGQGTTGSPITGQRWAMYAQPGDDFTLLSSDGGTAESASGYLSSLMFVDRRMGFDEITALGGPTAGGLAVAGDPPPPISAVARRVGIIAHRGDSADAPENTLAALQNAVDAGAQAIEIDVRMTRDGDVVLMHDADLSRTTNGSGSVSNRSTADVVELDAGSWFDPRYAGEPVPTLEDALMLVKGTDTRLYLDVKQEGMGQGIRAALDGAGMSGEDLWIWTYSESSRLNILGAVDDAQFVTGETTMSQIRFDELKQQGVIGFDLSMGQGGFTEAFVERAHENQLFVSAYTLLDPDSMLEAIDRGVDYMETDFPEVLDALMYQWGDFNYDEQLDQDDVDQLSQAIRSGNHERLYDLNHDWVTNLDDLRNWVTDLRMTYFGDANLDGEFNSSDLVNVFRSGRYESGAAANWSEGDWDADGQFGSSDLVIAFSEGGYEQGPRSATAVPEPAGSTLLLICLIALYAQRSGFKSQIINDVKTK